MDLYLTRSKAMQICRTEVRKMDETLTQEAVSDFVKKNSYQVYLACNIWLLYMEHVGITPVHLHAVRELILREGLVSTIKEARDFGEEFLHTLKSEALINEFDEHLTAFNRAQCQPWAGIARDLRNVDVSFESFTNRDACLTIHQLIQVCFMLERFTLEGVTCHKVAGLQKWKAVNDNCKRLNNNWKSWPGLGIRMRVRDELAEILNGLRWERKDLQYAKFSSGSTADGDSLTKDKVATIAHIIPGYKGFLECPLPVTKTNASVYTRMTDRVVPHLIAVPKTLDKMRIIAPESTYRAFVGQSGLEKLRRTLVRNHQMGFINERDDSVNNQLAKIGSDTAAWSTIDMSSASDSIARNLFFACLPTQYHSFFMRFMTNYVQLDDGNLKSLSMLYTSGNPLCWLTESVWFLALCKAAQRLAGVRRPQVFVYGDDVIVPTEYYDITIEMLTAFGHTVNSRKSYGTGGFRESCGGWYYCGVDVTPNFWPRHPVPNPRSASNVPKNHLQEHNKASLLGDLLTMQHKFYLMPLVDEFLRTEIHQLYPKMTHSNPDFGLDDIWDKDVTPQATMRGRHTCITERFDDQGASPVFLAWKYYEYLELGPRYNDDLDRLLGISTSRLPMPGELTHGYLVIGTR